MAGEETCRPSPPPKYPISKGRSVIHIVAAGVFIDAIGLDCLLQLINFLFSMARI
jgi:hypothetical protein